MLELFQMMGEDSWLSWILWLVFFMVFYMFYPRIMTSQILWKIEKSAKTLEEMTAKSKVFVLKEMGGSSNKAVKESVERFFEFFLIEPVSIDPFGVMKKIEYLVQEQKERFDYFIDQNMHADAEKKACISMGLAGGITLNMISKIVRHYVELVRKTKSIQIAMILQMQLPMIERMAKAVYKGTLAMSKGHPIGDGIGPLVAASYMSKPKEIEEDIVASSFKMNGRKVIVLKAKGPGGRLGRPGKAVDKLVRKHRIARIIAIDAAAKLEGERTGSMAEGVGVAMGGPGVERTYIEETAVKKRIPLDSIIVKMGQEEAITPMKKAIKDALPAVKESIARSVARAKKGSTIILIGVGNTSGVGNSPKAVQEASSWVDKYDRIQTLKRKGKAEED